MRKRAKEKMVAKGFVEIDVQDWSDLKERLATVEANLEQIMNNHLVHIQEEVTWIKNRLNGSYRPPWAIVAIITFLSALSVGLLVHALF